MAFSVIFITDAHKQVANMQGLFRKKYKFNTDVGVMREKPECKDLNYKAYGYSGECDGFDSCSKAYASAYLKLLEKGVPDKCIVKDSYCNMVECLR